MTQNQIALFKAREEQRSHMEQERVARGELAVKEKDSETRRMDTNSQIERRSHQNENDDLITGVNAAKGIMDTVGKALGGVLGLLML